MSVKLVRQASDTPNITNRDDSRMTRFAYGGINGVMKGYGNELTHSITGSKFGLNSGCIVLHGWEVLVDSWELDLSTVVNTQYHTVYLEVNVASESATIKSTYQTGAFPSIDAGNDLTTYPNGTARLPLYTFVVTSGRISSVTKKFTLLSYYGDRFKAVENDIADIEQRLSKLGFKEGSVIVPDSTSEFGSYITSSNSALNRQGNYVIGTYVVELNNMIVHEDQVYSVEIGTIPAQFLPAYNLSIFGRTIAILYAGSGPIVYTTASIFADITIDKSTGKMVCNFTFSHSDEGNMVVARVSKLLVPFGYEAAPLT